MVPWYLPHLHFFSTDGFIVFFHRNSCGDFGPFEKLIDSVYNSYESKDIHHMN